VSRINHVAKIIVIAGLILMAVGCSYFRASDSPQDQPQEEKKLSKVGIGAAAGAAVGAGIGAIIGSSSGSAGEGVAVGSVAGAVAGGAIGAGLEARDEKLAEQRSSIREQNVQISKQQAQLDDLRGAVIEIPRENSSSWKPGTPPERYSGNPTAHPMNHEAASRSYEIDTGNKPARGRLAEPYKGKPQETPPAARVQPAVKAAVSPKLPAPAAMETKPVEKVEVSETVSAARSDETLGEETLIAEPDPVLPAEQAGNASGLPPARLETTEADEAGLAAAPAVPPAAGFAKSSDAVEVNKADQAGKSAPAVEGTGCTEAEAEAARARTAASDADKLFYFRRALRLCPMEPGYHLEIGRVYAAIGRTDDARFSFNKALEIDPENQRAQEELSLLMVNNSPAKGKRY